VGIEFMPMSVTSQTPNESLFASVGGSRTTAEEAFFISVYTDPLAEAPSDQRFGAAPQFQGINPFGLLRRF
jgi:hypothetical protein